MSLRRSRRSQQPVAQADRRALDRVVEGDAAQQSAAQDGRRFEHTARPRVDQYAQIGEQQGVDEIDAVRGERYSLNALFEEAGYSEAWGPAEIVAQPQPGRVAERIEQDDRLLKTHWLHRLSKLVGEQSPRPPMPT